MNELIVKIEVHDSDSHIVRVEGHAANFYFASKALDDGAVDLPKVVKSFNGDIDQYRLLRECVGLSNEFSGGLDSAILTQIGEWLFNTLFQRSYEAMSVVRNAINDATQQSPLLLMIEVVELGSDNQSTARRMQQVPWELVREPGAQYSWGKNPNIVCVRVSRRRLLPPAHSAGLSLESDPRLSIAFLGASLEVDGRRLPLDKEMAELTELVDQNRHLMTFKRKDTNASRKEIENVYFRNEPDFLFLSCHAHPPAKGGRTHLIYQNVQGTQAEEIDLVPMIENGGPNQKMPRLIAINGCRSIDLAHDLADRGVISLGLTGKIQNEVAQHLPRNLVWNLLWHNQFHVAVHKMRSDLVKELNQHRIDSNTASWQAMFIAVVIPYDCARELFSEKTMGRLVIESEEIETIEVRGIKFDASKYQQAFTYEVLASKRQELLLRAGAYRIDLPQYEEHAVFELRIEETRTITVNNGTAHGPE